ncbi:class I SAM-dependent methyltransferase [Chitinophaga sp.]|uniref:class I SAM-dependent methyltransferase n=1 Tax=Chitinophaga sp. TaxID=1869181 RepID=UPI002F92F424
MKPYFKQISQPHVIGEELMADAINGLRAAGYTLAACAARLGVNSMSGIPFFNGTPSIQDKVTLLLDLFIRQKAVLMIQLEEILSIKQLESLQQMNLINVEAGEVTSDFCLFPCYDKYIVTDHIVKNDAINQIMYLFTESYILGGVVERKPLKRTLDLCTGSGVHAILAASHSEEVIGIDINPRAIAFAEFNAQLNGVHNAKFLLGDLYQPVEGDFDLIIANPPYNPDVLTRAGENFWSGGVTGMEVLSQIIKGLPAFLAEGGRSIIISLFPIMPGTTIQQYVTEWLGSDSAYFDAFESTVFTDNSNSIYYQMPAYIKNENFRFGLLRLKKRVSSKAGEWQVHQMQAVFDGAGVPMHTIKL